VRRDEFLAGGPMVRGRWSAVACLWWSGYLIGRTQPVYDLWKVDNNTVWDWISVGLGMIALVFGLIFLDQYGRNCWFSWTFDDVKWDGRFTRDEVKRHGWIPWRHSSVR